MSVDFASVKVVIKESYYLLLLVLNCLTWVETAPKLNLVHSCHKMWQVVRILLTFLNQTWCRWHSYV